MKTTKTMFRIFTIADYEQEEQFLRQQHQNGWKLKRITAFGFYHFEACTPEDVVYRLDFRTKGTDWDSYFQLFSDYGWEYFPPFRNGTISESRQTLQKRIRRYSVTTRPSGN